MSQPLLIAFIGVGGALLGSVVGAVTTYFVQTKLISTQAGHDTKKSLLEKQLVALQELNLVIDFALGNVGKTEGGPVGDLFESIIKESPKCLSFLPSAIRDDGRKLMFQYFKGARHGTVKLDEQFLESLRDRVNRSIDETYSQYNASV